MKNLKLFLSLSLGLVSLCANGENNYTPLIEEGKVWEYYLVYDVGKVPCRTLTQYAFMGTEERDGIDYHCLMKTHVRALSYDYEKGQPYIDESSPMSLEALMREEEGKVYMYIDSAEVLKFNPDAPEGTIMPWEQVSLPGNHEVLLYDFSAISGERVETWMPCLWPDYIVLDPQMMLMDCEVVSDGAEGYGSKNFQEIKMKNQCIQWLGLYDGYPDGWDNWGITYVEGVGNVGAGTMTLLGGQMLAVPSGQGGYWRYFNNLYDSEGNVIYPGAGEIVNDPNQGNSVKEIGQESVTCGKTYDIMGREVRETVPGGIYIRDGRKFIGR